MKWDEMRQSDNVEDVRDGSSSPSSSPMGMLGGLGFGGVAIALIASFVFKINPAQILSFLNNTSQNVPAPQSLVKTPAKDRDSTFVRSVLGDTEDTWNRIFKQQLKTNYQAPKLVLFNGYVNSACGSAKTSAGPFYCPADRKVYLDMGFFKYLEATAGNNADFARAYAIAHEVGHHIQNLRGTSGKVRQLKSSSSKAKANELSVRLELQADCLAGVWGHFTAQKGLITDQDVAKALDTATQIGDDYLQKQSKSGHVIPESFTHGTSQQRVTWFKRGLNTGDIDQCDTFEASQL
ncbi:neutral zinc metallopeptidase [Pseudanabaena sp. FACHB-1998]|uniref:KPN_02809 family neutral zinc metallopeptidase n=1 Tax=Pseudanabaena sp. FACHB-1998 TaxID=2692858 RepID=UPI0016811E10|nr:neutral zinc metallopeptidase [Pseudanabaena sp. FACHB-1998]MBD2177258.1 neutral zinc metallopeptidase [Pseudanabaena sp. FACHB-1998]